MVFPLYVTLERMDRTLVEASKDLGAGRWATFRQITLPIALPGLITGSILVFIPMMGEYVIPQILGYGRMYLMGNALVTDFLEFAQLAVRGRQRPSSSSSSCSSRITVYLWFLNRGRPDPRRQRPVSAPMPVPSHPQPHARPDRRGAPRSIAGPQLVEVLVPGACDARLRRSCTCRSSSSSCSAFNATPRLRHASGTGFSLRWYEVALGDQDRPASALANSFLDRRPERGPGDGLRDDGGARAPARQQGRSPRRSTA